MTTLVEEKEQKTRVTRDVTSLRKALEFLEAEGDVLTTDAEIWQAAVAKRLPAAFISRGDGGAAAVELSGLESVANPDLGAQVAGLEYLTKENLLMSWGGIVETAVFNGGVATKVGEILYAFWECRKRGDEAVRHFEMAWRDSPPATRRRSACPWRIPSRSQSRRRW